MTNPYQPPSETDSKQNAPDLDADPTQSRVWIAWAMLAVACFAASGMTASPNRLAELIALTLFVAGVIFAMLAVLSQTDRRKQQLDAQASASSKSVPDETTG